MWKLFESIVVLVAIGVAAALLACRAKKTLDGAGGADGCGGCGKEKSRTVIPLDSLLPKNETEEEDDDDDDDGDA